MTAAYVDSSCLVAVLLSEPGSAALARRIERQDVVCTSTFLEAELAAVAVREGVSMDERQLDAFAWIQPQRRLTPEIARVLSVRYLRGAGLWHLACALYLFDDPTGITFLTLDAPQREAAGKLGFLT